MLIYGDAQNDVLYDRMQKVNAMWFTKLGLYEIPLMHKSFASSSIHN